jgi:hypothetical protein
MSTKAKQELIAAERDAVAAYLRMSAAQYRKKEDNPRAYCNRPDVAKIREAVAAALDNIAPLIINGSHWQ